MRGGHLKLEKKKMIMYIGAIAGVIIISCLLSFFLELRQKGRYSETNPENSETAASHEISETAAETKKEEEREPMPSLEADTKAEAAETDPTDAPVPEEYLESFNPTLEGVTVEAQSDFLPEGEVYFIKALGEHLYQYYGKIEVEKITFVQSYYKGSHETDTCAYLLKLEGREGDAISLISTYNAREKFYSFNLTDTYYEEEAE